MSEKDQKEGLRSGKIGLYRDGGLRVYVKELVWPGDEKDIEEIQNKWIYVILEKKIIAEVNALNKQKWNVWYEPDLQKPEAKRDAKPSVTEGYIELDPDLNNKYHFFLSPIQMTAKAADYLITWIEESAVNKRFNSNPGFVNVPDPWRWGEDVHLNAYIPALENWDVWLKDEDAQAKYFIATTLKGWIKAGLKITKELRDPARIDQEINAELEARKDAEEACCRLAHCVDSHRDRAIEISAQHNGGEDLAHALLHWCVISYRLIDTEPGRFLASALIRDENRILRTHIFTDAQKPAALDFKLYRHGWYGALGAFSELAPAMINFLKSDTLKKMAAYLGNLEIHCGQKEFAEIIEHIPPQLKDRISDIIKRAKKLIIKRMNFVAPQSYSELAGIVAKMGDRAGKTYSHFVNMLKSRELPVGAILETINVFCAWKDYLDADAEEASDKGLDLLGAFADSLEFFAPYLSQVASKREWIRLGKGVKAIGPAAGFIGGAADMLEYGRDALDGVNKNNYQNAVGNAVAALGGATMSLGCGMAVASAVAAKFFGASVFGGPAGVIVGAVGAVLIIGGLVGASFFVKTPYQDFARLCFLGKDRGEAVYYGWARGGLGNGVPLSEAAILLNLLGSFRLVVSYENDEARARKPESELIGEHAIPGDRFVQPITLKVYRHWIRRWVKIEYGFVTKASVFDVRIEWYREKGQMLRRKEYLKVQESCLELYPISQEEKNVSGPSRVSSEYLRETMLWSKSTCSFAVDCSRKTGEDGEIYPRVLARLRVLGNLDIWVPPSRAWLEIDLHVSGKYSSSSIREWGENYMVSSLDDKCYVRLRE